MSVPKCETKIYTYIIAGRIHKHLLPTFTDQSLSPLVTVKRKCHQTTNNKGDEKIKWNLQRRASINEFKLPHTGSNGMALNLKLEAANVVFPHSTVGRGEDFFNNSACRTACRMRASAWFYNHDESTVKWKLFYSTIITRVQWIANCATFQLYRVFS